MPAEPNNKSLKSTSVRFYIHTSDSNFGQKFQIFSLTLLSPEILP